MALPGGFALQEATHLFKGLRNRETDRPSAMSRLYASARFMPSDHMSRLSHDSGRLILGVKSRSPMSGRKFYPLAGAVLTPAPPQTGKTATIALNLLRPGGAGFGRSTIFVDPRGAPWSVTA